MQGMMMPVPIPPGAAGGVPFPPQVAAVHAAAAPATGKGGAPARYKKAPDAPKRFKSAFIIFSAEKHKSIKAEHQKEGKAEKVRESLVLFDYTLFRFASISGRISILGTHPLPGFAPTLRSRCML